MFYQCIGRHPYCSTKVINGSIPVLCLRGILHADYFFQWANIFKILLRLLVQYKAGIIIISSKINLGDKTMKLTHSRRESKVFFSWITVGIFIFHKSCDSWCLFVVIGKYRFDYVYDWRSYFPLSNYFRAPIVIKVSSFQGCHNSVKLNYYGSMIWGERCSSFCWYWWNCWLSQFKLSFHNLRGYHTLQGDNSLKSVERFDHMMFVCKHLGDQNHREKSCYVTSEYIALSLLVGMC